MLINSLNQAFLFLIGISQTSVTKKGKRVMMEENRGVDTAKPATAPAMTSCRKKKKDDATFLEDLKDHIDEFIHASMDEHKECFKKTMNKMFAMSKIVSQKTAAESDGVESLLPLQTTVSD